MRKTIVAVVLGLGFALCAATWTLALRRGWITGQHTLAWVDGAGKPIEAQACVPQGLGGVVIGDRWILPCDLATISGLAALDPRRGLVELRWPVDGELVAITAGPDEQLGTVNATDAALVVGIAGRDGWLRAPESLGTGKFGRVLGIAWVDGGVEVVHVPAEGDDTSGSHTLPRVSHVVVGRPITTRVWASRGPCDDPNAYCVNEVAVHDDQHGWRVLEQRFGGATYVAIDGTSSAGPASFARLGPTAYLDGVDTTELGLATHSIRMPALVLGADGVARPYPASPIAGLIPSAPTILRYDRGRLIPLRWWERPVPRRDPEILRTRLGNTTFDNAQQIDGDTIAVRYADHVVAMGPSFDALRTVARDFGGANALAIVPSADGYFLLSAEMLALHLDREFHRIDPLSLRDHLRTKGSTWAYGDDGDDIYAIGWLLLGWPALMVVGLVIAWRSRTRVSLELLAMLTVVYLIFSYSAYRLLPLLV